MAKNVSMPDEGHEATGAEYQKECQRLIDQANYAGTGQPCFPDKIIVHEYDSPYSDDVRHIYVPKPDKDSDR